MIERKSEISLPNAMKFIHIFAYQWIHFGFWQLYVEISSEKGCIFIKPEQIEAAN